MFLKTSAASPLVGGVFLSQATRAAEQPEPFNEVIQRARQAALDVLKPTPKQLEHGLELHAAAVVCESYGFSPSSAVDGDAMRKAIESAAPPEELEDLREEMNMTRCVTSAAERAEYQEAWRASGLTCIFQNAGEENNAPLRVLKRLARFTYVTDMMRDFVAKAATPDDIVAAKKAGKRCLYFSANAVPLTQDWSSAEGELRYIRIFFQLGIRMMHMTYNRRNLLGDGCAETANAGLSDFGRMAIAEMNRLGVIPDVAHAGWQTSLETAQCSKRPAVISHSACDGVNHHIRCKPDNVIRAIADSGGYIGICAVPSFLGGKGDIGALLDHIDYAVRRFGADHVAIGTDVGYSSRNSAAERRKIPKTARNRTRWEALWPPNSFPIPDGNPSLAWTNWPMFTVGMVQRGHSDADIQKILGGNVLRVARASLA
jgi:membrane dipeptidase